MCERGVWGVMSCNIGGLGARGLERRDVFRRRIGPEPGGTAPHWSMGSSTTSWERSAMSTAYASGWGSWSMAEIHGRRSNGWSADSIWQSARAQWRRRRGRAVRRRCGGLQWDLAGERSRASRRIGDCSRWGVRTTSSGGVIIE